MKTWAKVLLVLGLLYAVFVATAAYAFYAIVLRPGAIYVNVREGGHHGSRVNVRVPASFANAGIRLAGFAARHGDWSCVHHDEHLAFAHSEADEWRPFVRAVADELDRMPDATLVEIDSWDDRVRILKRNGGLVIEVQGGRDHVRVTVPPSTVSLLFRTAGQL